MQMGKLGLCLDGDGAGAETDVPEMASLPQVEQAEAQEANGHLRDHLLPAVQMGKSLVGDAKQTRLWLLTGQDQTVWLLTVELCRLFQCALPDALQCPIAQTLANSHPIIIKSVSQKPSRNGGGCMDTIGQHADLCGLFDQCPIQLVPRASGQGDDTHPLVGHD